MKILQGWHNRIATKNVILLYYNNVIKPPIKNVPRRLWYTGINLDTNILTKMTYEEKTRIAPDTSERLNFESYYLVRSLDITSKQIISDNMHWLSY